MNPAGVIEMDVDVARTKLTAYRDAKFKDVAAEYEACVAGYEQLAEGKKLIDISAAIAAGGFDSKMRPKLAIARADRQVVRMRWDARSTRMEFNASFRPDGQSTSMRREDLFVSVDVGVEHGLTETFTTKSRGTETWGFRLEAWAKVPMIPADVRPKRGQLESWHILWEVEHWHDRAPLARPSRDPYLLKHVGGTLYAVIAEWNLTELEIAVMR